ncbi:MAG: hypothetical protein RLY93_20160 [Sumerlaeia bacterium]
MKAIKTFNREELSDWYFQNRVGIERSVKWGALFAAGCFALYLIATVSVNTLVS